MVRNFKYKIDHKNNHATIGKIVDIKNHRIFNNNFKKVLHYQYRAPHSLKGNKGQNQYLTRVFFGKIQVTFSKCVLYPDKVIFEK